MQEAEPYRDAMDFAFFAAHFGYSKSEYQELTEVEKAFLRKAWEDRIVSWSTLVRDAVLNGVSNALRKKGKRFRPLWKKRNRKADKDMVRDDLKTVLEIEEHETGWIDRIYEANGMKKPQKKGG